MTELLHGFICAQFITEVSYLIDLAIVELAALRIELFELAYLLAHFLLHLVGLDCLFVDLYSLTNIGFLCLQI